MKSHKFFTMNTPDPAHWTINACIGAFCIVWVHFGLFRYCMKLGAKWVELVQLMQKFVQRTRIGIFGNECTRSTPLDPKLMFWCVFVVFGCICQLGAKRVELVQLMKKFVPRNCIRVFRNERMRSTPLNPKFMFWCIFIVFGCICQCFVTT